MTAPLRRMSLPGIVWRVVYPWAIHFGLLDLTATLVVAYAGAGTAGAAYLMNRYAVLLTGLCGALTTCICTFFYRRDRRRRLREGLVQPRRKKSFGIPKALLFLGIGAGLSLYGNIIVNILMQLFSANMDAGMESSAAGLLMELLCLGIAAPLAEEAAFRWLVFLRLRDHVKLFPAVLISAVMFGVYHMDLWQGVYAALIGMIFAYLMEKTGSLLSTTLMHAGANIFSILFNKYGAWANDSLGWTTMLFIYILLLAILVLGTAYLCRTGKRRGERREI